MATFDSFAIEIIPTLEITTIHTDNEPSILVEHFSDIQELKGGSQAQRDTSFLWSKTFL